MLTEEYLRREYGELCRSAASLGVDAGCSHKTVLRYLGQYGIPSRRRGRRVAAYPELRSVSFLRERCLSEGASAAGLAAEIGCSRSTAAAALRRAGLSRVGRSPHDDRLTAAFLIAAYVEQRRSTGDIAAEVGCGPTTIGRHLRRHGIAIRRPGGPHRE